MSSSDTLRRNLPAIGAAVRNIVIFLAVLSIPLTAAADMGLTPAQTISWILALFGVPALLSLVLVARYRQPLQLTGNLFVIIFIAGLGSQYSYPVLVGASLVAGAAVALIGGLGLTNWLAKWIPIPVVFGLLGGAALPFVFDMFTYLGQTPVLVGGILVVYLASRALPGERVPAILPALVAGLVITALTGQFGQAAEPLRLVIPAITRPAFSLQAILSITPVFIFLIVLQANLPSVRYLQGQGYEPPTFVLGMVSGLGTVLGSLLGPTGISLSLPVTSLVSGPEAGVREIRHRSVIMASGAALLVGALAGFAARLPEVLPRALLVTLAGLALVDVLGSALRRMGEGPLRLGPLLAFAVSLSDISLLGFGPFFWALVIGTAVSLLVEREAVRALREGERADENA